MNITYVTPYDYQNITKSFTIDEITEKYSKLIILPKNEYKEMQKKKRDEK